MFTVRETFLSTYYDFNGKQQSKMNIYLLMFPIKYVRLGEKKLAKIPEAANCLRRAIFSATKLTKDGAKKDLPGSRGKSIIIGEFQTSFSDPT